MSTSYHVYMNDSAGGPVNYGSIIATVSALTWTSGTLANSTDTTFAVRAFDTSTGFEEQNVAAKVRVLIDASGNDITAIPNPPSRFSAIATSGGGARLDWTYNAAGQGGPPTGFRVWLTVGGTVNYAASPVLTAAYSAGSTRFSAVLTGLSDGVAYSIGIRATNATGTESNTTIVAQITGKSSAPSDVDGLAVAATFTP